MENLWFTEKYGPFATQTYNIRQVKYFSRKKINLNKKCELSHYVPHTVHSETVLFFPINNIIYRIIIYICLIKISKRCHTIKQKLEILISKIYSQNSW